MKRFTEEEKDEIRDLLLWNQVEVMRGPAGEDSFEAGVLKVKNPKTWEEKILLVAGHEGGCSCSAGDYFLTELNGTGWNAVTNVEFEDDPAGDDTKHPDYTGHYRIFVYCEDKKIKLAEFEGSDGNGYYGTGYWIEVYE